MEGAEDVCIKHRPELCSLSLTQSITMQCSALTVLREGSCRVQEAVGYTNWEGYKKGKLTKEDINPTARYIKIGKYNK